MMCSRYLLVTTSTFNFVFHGAQEHPIVFKQLPFYIKDQGHMSVQGISGILILILVQYLKIGMERMNLDAGCLREWLNADVRVCVS